MRSHTLQPDWSVRHHPSQEHLGGLRHHNVPLCPSTWVSGCKGGHDTTFSPLTPLCVWFWRVVIQGHGVSCHDPQTFLQCPLFFDLYVPLQHSCLLHPCMNLYQTLFIPNVFPRVVLSFPLSPTLFLVGVLEGLKELKTKNLTWIKVVNSSLDVFATPMTVETPRLGESSVCCPRVYTPSP